MQRCQDRPAGHEADAGIDPLLTAEAVVPEGAERAPRLLADEAAQGVPSQRRAEQEGEAKAGGQGAPATGAPVALVARHRGARGFGAGA
jgi:hypothetical protein